jgi:hypothetical protein
MIPVSARMEDDTMKLGLLMEAAQAQQTLATDALDRLREHTAGLDAIVRQEIRATFIEEARALGEEYRRATEALRRLQRIANLRLLIWSVALVTLGVTIPLFVIWCMLPTRAEVIALAVRRDELTANIAHLTRQGADLELRHCGSAQRMCVRVDRSAPPYGENADFLVIKGH